MAQAQPQPWCQTEEGLALLQRIRDNDESLTDVDLHEHVLRDEDAGELASALQSNSNVDALWLDGNEIGDDGVAALAGVPQDSPLAYLNLRGNRIREAMAGLVQNNSTIECLDLDNNQIEDGGGRALAMALVHNSTLKLLWLERNSIGDGGAEALASAICLNPSLLCLDLRRNMIGERGTRSLITAMRNLGGEGIGQEDVANFVKGLFVETSPITLGPEELGAIKQHLTAGHTREKEFELGSGLVGVPVRVMRAGQQNLLRAVVGEGMVRAAVS